MRIEWVKTRLNNWAMWKAREQAGGLGYATASAMLAERVDDTRESRIPVDEIDAAKTDQAVESLRPGNPELYETVYLMHVFGIGAQAAGRRCGCETSTIHARLGQADRLLSAWMAERKAQLQEGIVAPTLGQIRASKAAAAAAEAALPKKKSRRGVLHLRRK